ncbi:hypothetical protein Ssi03_36950 [Sphaerisporangium siamense]|uniref:Uncharacterized protein n=1 Tax=Sphaerisporangium siamense TaxID=795645 RepID=A0A7W7D786_9ACTN|nr:hypothetical protein [Sphaerisporangium siamense]MBB4701579.1 hypothetical protein [Sphaerisporangium siamense]GII85705.1 hypothetical protein Ssi03_36950 [Sphaerisporangium siamense]
MFRTAIVIATALIGLSFSAATVPANAARPAPAAATQVTAPRSAPAAAQQAACAPGGCGSVQCPAGYVCVYSPKQCFTTPCPQYECVPANGGTPIPPTYPPVVVPGWPYPTPQYPPYWWYGGTPHVHYPRPVPLPTPLPRPHPHPHPHPHHDRPMTQPAAVDGQPPAQAQQAQGPQAPGGPGATPGGAR